jgi:Pectinacetylesterase
MNQRCEAMAEGWFCRPSTAVAGIAVGLFFAPAAGGVAAEPAPAMAAHTIAVPGLPNALCNDGTLPLFYFRPGSGDDRNRWLIFFQDGGGCTSDAACATRARNNPYFVSGVGNQFPRSVTGDGILSTQPSVNPDFADYNHVLLHYCSSDGYAGDTSRVIDGVTWQFRGKEIVAALFQQLMDQSIDGAPTLSSATDVLVAGSSVGAVGVGNNLDRIAAQLAPVRVRGLADSDWIPVGTIPFLRGSFAQRPDQPPAMAYFNAQPDDSCVAANSKNPAACLAEAFVFPYLATPMFIYADQRDASILAALGIPASPTSEDQADYVSGFAGAVRESLRATVPAYFAADVAIHNVLLWPLFARVQSDNGETFGGTLHSWYFGTPGNLQVAAPPPGAPPLSLAR